MKLVRSMMLFAAAVLVGAVTLTAQGGQKQWTDEAYDKVMKEVGATAGAMRKAVEGQNAELAKTNATKMVSLFTDVNAFWTSRNVKEAATIANSALTHAKAVESAVDAKDFTKAAESAKTMQGACAECHKTYATRDRTAPGALSHSFRPRAPGLRIQAPGIRPRPQAQGPALRHQASGSRPRASGTWGLGPDYRGNRSRRRPRHTTAASAAAALETSSGTMRSIVSAGVW